MVQTLLSCCFRFLPSRSRWADKDHGFLSGSSIVCHTLIKQMNNIYDVINYIQSITGCDDKFFLAQLCYSTLYFFFISTVPFSLPSCFVIKVWHFGPSIYIVLLRLLTDKNDYFSTKTYLLLGLKNNDETRRKTFHFKIVGVSSGFRFTQVLDS